VLDGRKGDQCEARQISQGSTWWLFGMASNFCNVVWSLHTNKCIEDEEGPRAALYPKSQLEQHNTLVFHQQDVVTSKWPTNMFVAQRQAISLSRDAISALIGLWRPVWRLLLGDAI
jgi:hypothetical protein